MLSWAHFELDDPTIYNYDSIHDVPYSIIKTLIVQNKTWAQLKTHLGNYVACISERHSEIRTYLLRARFPRCLIIMQDFVDLFI